MLQILRRHCTFPVVHDGIEGRIQYGGMCTEKKKLFAMQVVEDNIQQ